MWHSEPHDLEPDPNPVRNPGSGSVYNKYGSASLVLDLFFSQKNLLK